MANGVWGGARIPAPPPGYWEPYHHHHDRLAGTRVGQFKWKSMKNHPDRLRYHCCLAACFFLCFVYFLSPLRLLVNWLWLVCWDCQLARQPASLFIIYYIYFMFELTFLLATPHRKLSNLTTCQGPTRKTVRIPVCRPTCQGRKSSGCLELVDPPCLCCVGSA